VKALVFDLDGTLVDSVYPHTLAWQRALMEFDLVAPAWEIHRRIGISGKLLVKAIARERGLSFSETQIGDLERRHAVLFRELRSQCKPLPGAVKLLMFLREAKIAHGLATSGKREEIAESLRALELGPDAVVIDGTAVERAKPEPDLFVECQKALAVDKSECIIVGDAIWDVHAARRAGILAVGLLTGGFAEQELYNAGAMRVYRDVAELHQEIDELGVIN
jgi:HAD superfamily hydrolase (TIGR01549 family)